MNWMRICEFCLCLVLGAPAIAQSAKAEPRGAEIHAVQPARPGALAGLKSGDLISGYQAAGQGASGSISSALDLITVDLRWSDLGPLRLSGSAGRTSRDWQLRGNGWGIKLRPATRGNEREQLLAALDALESGATAAGCTQLLALAAAWENERRGDALWAQWRCLDERIRKRELGAAAPMIDALWPVADPDERVPLGLIAVKLAAAAYDIADWALLERLLGHARAAFEGDPLLRSLADLREGKSRIVRGQFAQVLELLEPAAATLRRLAPESLRLAAVENELAWAHLNLDHLATAEDLLRDAIARASRYGENDVDLSKYQGHLGIVLHARNDLAGAEREVSAALERLIAVQAGDKFTAPVWNNLGVIRRERGDYVGAEDAFRQTIAMEEKRDPAWVAVAIAYGNMASIARARGDLVATRRWAERARPILEKAVPEGTEVAQNRHLLGGIALDQGDFDTAADWYARAIALWEKIAPQTQRHALSIEQLGVIAQRRGDFAGARERFRQALAIRQQVRPGGLDEGLSWYRIGSLELDAGEFASARRALEKSVAIGTRIAPETLHHANALNALGRSQQALGEAELARVALCESARLLDSLRARLSRDPREQAQAMAQYARIRQDCVFAEIEAGHPDRAFEFLERGRGRALLGQLGQRDLAFSSELPLRLRREWLALEADLERVRNRRSLLGADANSASIADLGAESQALESQRGLLIEELRRVAPRFAALQFPQPLTLAEMHAMLDPDTALVALSIGTRHGYALVLRRSQAQPRVHRLELQRERLAVDVAELRAAIMSGAEPALSRLARALHARLIAPLEPDLRGIRRLVLVPDAELFALPYAVLQDQRGRLLIEDFSFSIADSATLWATPSRREHATAEHDLLAIAHGAASGSAASTSSLRTYPQLPALPFAEPEVAAIAALTPGPKQLLFAAAATERRAAALARTSSRVHFAVHGVFDPVAPLESGLLLHADGQATGAAADGLLQAWEIFDDWQTDAQLVTLSGCDTGQGASLADEGLVGLTRAFQFAGAHNVVASLWSVSDRSTATLMTRFYAALARGTAVDLALREAQLSMLHERETAAAMVRRGVGGLQPARMAAERADWTWAAFQVYGGREPGADARAKEP